MPAAAIGVALVAGATPGSAGLLEQTVQPVAVVTGEPRAAGPDAAVEFWVLVDRHSRLHPHFVAAVAGELASAPRDVCAYTDFTLAEDGREELVRVGMWSVERSRWLDYTGPVLVVGAALVSAEPSEIPIRVAAPRRAGEVRYLSESLYTTTNDLVAPIGPRARAQLYPGLPYAVSGSWPRVERQLHPRPTVSVLIPTRGATARVFGRETRLVDNCLTALRPVLEDVRTQLVLVLDSDGPQDFAEPWRALLGERLTVLTTDPPFNFSEKVNRGIEAATGEYVVLLNDDVQPITADWLDHMVALASEPDVGAVGALLVYEDGTVQHAGHAFSEQAVHLIDKGLPLGPGPRRRNACDRDVSGVTAACLVQRRAVWEKVGGLDPSFPVAFNDVEYCDRIRALGLRVVQCNLARLYHFESRTRAGTAEPQEVALMLSKLDSSLLDRPDPFTPDLTVRYPPQTLRSRARRAREVLGSEGLAGVVRRARRMRRPQPTVDSAGGR